MIWKVIVSCAASVLWLWFAAGNIDLVPNVDWLSLPILALLFIAGPAVVWWGVAKLTRLL